MIRAPRNPYTQALVSVSARRRTRPTRAERAKRTILVGETPDAAHVPPGCRFNPRCPLAFDRCRTDEPPLFDVGGGQQAACWLAEGGAIEAEAGAGRPPPRRPEPESATPRRAAGASGVSRARAGSQSGTCSAPGSSAGIVVTPPSITFQASQPRTAPTTGATM